MDQFKETRIQGDELNFLIPWYSDNSNMEDELARELIPGHLLYRKNVKTIARRQDCDDVLFEVFDADFKFAKVHLTWRMKPEINNTWPITRLFKDWKEVYEKCIIPDNYDWEESENMDYSKLEEKNINPAFSTHIDRLSNWFANIYKYFLKMAFKRNKS